MRNMSVQTNDGSPIGHCTVAIHIISNTTTWFKSTNNGTESIIHYTIASVEAADDDAARYNNAAAR